MAIGSTLINKATYDPDRKKLLEVKWAVKMGVEERMYLEDQRVYLASFQFLNIAPKKVGYHFFPTMPSATNEIGIAFSPNVKVTTTDMLKPTLTGLLSKVVFGNLENSSLRSIQNC